MSDVATMSQGMTVVEPTLDELTATVLREHAACREAATTTLEHAIRAGEALLQIRARFEDWRKHSPVASSTAYEYMRFALAQHLIPDGMSLKKGNALAKALPTLDGRRSNSPTEDVRKADAARLRKEGWSNRRIAREFGVAPSTIHYWFSGERSGRERRARAALAAQERQQEIRRVVKKKGGAIAEAYAMAERLDDVLGQAHDEAEDVEARRDLSAAHELQRGMRDRIVRALGVEG